METNEKQVLIDQEKLRKIEHLVYTLEKDNKVVGILRDNEVIEKIINIIASEVENDN